MAKEFVSPNLHVVLIHFPLGLLIAGTLIELFSFMWRRHAFRAAGRWMILLGALTAIPTATAGIYALSDVSRIGLSQEQASGPWNEVKAVSPLWKNPDSDAAEHMTDHAWEQAIATVLALIVCVTWLGCSDAWRVKLHLPLLAVLLVGMGFMVAGAWNGGEAVYRHGVAVRMEQESEHAQPATSSATQTSNGADQEHHRGFDLAHLVPLVEIHLIAAGLVFALALAALGLSIRETTLPTSVPRVDETARALGRGATSTGMESDIRDSMEVPQDVVRPRLPVARFWLLAALLGIVTASLGAWMLMRSMDMPLDRINVKELWSAVQNFEGTDRVNLTRRFAHLVGGGGIILLSLLLALIARAAAHARIVVFAVGALLVLFVAAQIWLGVLLLFDTNMGKITGFN